MITLNVPEIHCEVCAGRIKNALGKSDISCEVDVKNKQVKISDEHREEAIEILDDIGFSAELD
ncbi:MAG: heavy-metal-associated domain-containing protein [Ruminococcaceae bacterium]|nr:heavy-metal-associated domain-containing protein [Oscillospiraceae bacterium]